MRLKGYRLTRYADDWVVTCRNKAEAQAALKAASGILKKLGVTLHEGKTRIVHVRQGFEFLGYKIKRGVRLSLPAHKIRSGAQPGELYAYPRDKSIQKFKDAVRLRTRRKLPMDTQELIEWLNPVIRGWGNYFAKAHVRKLFNRLNRWIVRRLWSHRHKRWRCRITSYNVCYTKLLRRWRPEASHRPPLKPDVQFSRIRLSQGCFYSVNSKKVSAKSDLPAPSHRIACLPVNPSNRHIAIFCDDATKDVEQAIC